jgi:hypothetical protein
MSPLSNSSCPSSKVSHEGRSPDIGSGGLLGGSYFEEFINGKRFVAHHVIDPNNQTESFYFTPRKDYSPQSS